MSCGNGGGDKKLNRGGVFYKSIMEVKMKNTLSSNVFKLLAVAFIACFIMSGTAAAENQDTGGKVNINEATVKELAKLPGIGKKKAEAIVAHREKNGGFSDTSDLKRIDGIGKKTFERIRDRVTVEGG